MSGLDDPLQEQLLERWHKLPHEQQLQLLDYARSMPAQVPAEDGGAALLRLAGTISDADLKAMAGAIEEGCEETDLAGW